jgi:predicted dehydrogenase
LCSVTAPIRWGILATGGIAHRFVTDLRLLPDAEVVAVGSRSVEAAQRFAAQHGIARAHGSWSGLTEDPQVDVVYVATPHSAHHAATLTCLRAGKPVLTEKPFTLDAALARELFAVARAANLFVMEAMWMRCIPTLLEVKRQVNAGAIGRPTSVNADFRMIAPADRTHRIWARELGGGALLDLGVYPVALAHWFLGRPQEITAEASLTPEGVDQNTAAILKYADGAIATALCSLIGSGPRSGTIAGTEGHVDLPTPFHHPSGFTIYRGDQRTEVAMPFDGTGLRFEAAEVHRCLRAGLLESPLVPHAETLAVLSTLDTIRARIGVTYG